MTNGINGSNLYTVLTTSQIYGQTGSVASYHFGTCNIKTTPYFVQVPWKNASQLQSACAKRQNGYDVQITLSGLFQDSVMVELFKSYMQDGDGGEGMISNTPLFFHVSQQEYVTSGTGNSHGVIGATVKNINITQNTGQLPQVTVTLVGGVYYDWGVNPSITKPQPIYSQCPNPWNPKIETYDGSYDTNRTNISLVYDVQFADRSYTHTNDGIMTNPLVSTRTITMQQTCIIDTAVIPHAVSNNYIVQGADTTGYVWKHTLSASENTEVRVSNARQVDVTAPDPDRAIWTMTVKYQAIEDNFNENSLPVMVVVQN